MLPCLVKAPTLCTEGVSCPHSGPASRPCRGSQGGLLCGGPSSLSRSTHRQAPPQSICVPALAPHWGLRGPARGVGCLGLVFPVPAAPGQVAGLEPHASGAHAELELPPAGKRRGSGRCRLSKHHRPQRSTCRESAFPRLAGPSGDPRRGGTEGRSRDWVTGWERRGAGAGAPAGTLMASLPRGGEALREFQTPILEHGLWGPQTWAYIPALPSPETRLRLLSHQPPPLPVGKQ
uniref:Uncharacterized protein n=1 Tax=Pipistrellus kuhlii TaxID=59472 RepID=A0A7J7UTF8_PIPKU|nr:hypothetical protein mPipKuh1_008698 [Pipistrellus kuhlii]